MKVIFLSLFYIASSFSQDLTAAQLQYMADFILKEEAKFDKLSTSQQIGYMKEKYLFGSSVEPIDKDLMSGMDTTSNQKFLNAMEVNFPDGFWYYTEGTYQKVFIKNRKITWSNERYQLEKNSLQLYSILLAPFSKDFYAYHKSLTSFNEFREFIIPAENFIKFSSKELCEISTKMAVLPFSKITVLSQSKFNYSSNEFINIFCPSLLNKSKIKINSLECKNINEKLFVCKTNQNYKLNSKGIMID